MGNSSGVQLNNDRSNRSKLASELSIALDRVEHCLHEPNCLTRSRNGIAEKQLLCSSEQP